MMISYYGSYMIVETSTARTTLLDTQIFKLRTIHVYED